MGGGECIATERRAFPASTHLPVRPPLYDATLSDAIR